MNFRTAKSTAIKEAPGLHPRLWVKRYADYLYAFALLRVNCQDQARDLVQDTFLAALENAISFEKKSTEKTWLTGILKNKIFDFYREQYRPVKNGQSTPDPFFRNEDGHWKADQKPGNSGWGQFYALENKERQKVLLSCIRKLPQSCQAAFIMKHMEDVSTVTICRQLNLTTANFWVIIHRAKLNLRACLQKNLSLFQ